MLISGKEFRSFYLEKFSLIFELFYKRGMVLWYTIFKIREVAKNVGGMAMSRIKNEPKIKNKLIKAIREQLEHRALWLYLLCDEAEKRGLDKMDFASAAIKRCGLIHGKNLVNKGRTKSLKGLKKTLFTKPAQWVFEMDVLESTDEALSLDFHYCPLVKAWQKAGCSDEEIGQLCDIAMCGDHGIGARYDSILELPKCIAKGDEICALRYKKQKTGK